MIILSSRLPVSRHEQVKELAKIDGILINIFVVSAIAERMFSLLTEESIKDKTSKGNKKCILKNTKKSA